MQGVHGPECPGRGRGFAARVPAVGDRAVGPFRSTRGALVERMGGSLLREVRGNGAADVRPASSSARAKPAARTRAKAQPKRAAARTGANAQPKRAAAGTRAKARPKRTPRRRPLDDVTIARKVESTIFRGIDVDKGKIDRTSPSASSGYAERSGRRT